MVGRAGRVAAYTQSSGACDVAGLRRVRVNGSPELQPAVATARPQVPAVDCRPLVVARIWCAGAW